jgi:hypothetical protein
MKARALLERCRTFLLGPRRFTLSVNEVAVQIASALGSQAVIRAEYGGDAYLDGYVLGFSKSVLSASGCSGIVESMKVTAQVFEEIFGSGEGGRAVATFHKIRAGDSSAVAGRLAGGNDARQLMDDTSILAFARGRLLLR